MSKTNNSLSTSNIEPNWLKHWSKQELADLQNSDVTISEIKRLKAEYCEKPDKSKLLVLNNETIKLWQLWEVLEIHDNVLYFKSEASAVNVTFRLVAHEKIRSEVFVELHSQRYSGHLGRDRTLDAVKRRFFWPTISSDFALWVRQVDLCARRKPGPGKGKNQIQQIRAYRPMEIIAVDILGPLPLTKQNNEYIILCGCYFTKWVMAFPVPNHTAYTVADILVTNVFLQFGFPSQIHTDQGREFESHFFSAIVIF